MNCSIRISLYVLFAKLEAWTLLHPSQSCISVLFYLSSENWQVLPPQRSKTCEQCYLGIGLGFGEGHHSVSSQYNIVFERQVLVMFPFGKKIVIYSVLREKQIQGCIKPWNFMCLSRPADKWVALLVCCFSEVTFQGSYLTFFSFRYAGKKRINNRLIPLQFVNLYYSREYHSVFGNRSFVL